MKFTITIGADQLAKTYLQTMNGLLKLSPKEMDILVEFIHLRDQFVRGDLTGASLNALLFSPSSRKIIYTKLGISPFNLNNYISSLREKRMILVEDGLLILNPVYTTFTLVNNQFDLHFSFRINDTADIHPV